MLWQESPEFKEILELCLSYLRPMVEDARKMRDERAAADLAGETTPMGPLLPLTYFRPEYQRRALFAFAMDGSTYLMRDDGGVFLYSEALGGWVEHSAFPGTPADAEAQGDDA